MPTLSTMSDATLERRRLRYIHHLAALNEELQRRIFPEAATP